MRTGVFDSQNLTSLLCNWVVAFYLGAASVMKIIHRVKVQIDLFSA